MITEQDIKEMKELLSDTRALCKKVEATCDKIISDLRMPIETYPFLVHLFLHLGSARKPTCFSEWSMSESTCTRIENSCRGILDDLYRPIRKV